MFAFGILTILSAFALLDASLAHPMGEKSNGLDKTDLHRRPKIAAAHFPPAQAVAMTPVPIHKNSGKPLPRQLPRHPERALPMGHRPSGLGADVSMTPKKGSVKVTQRADEPIMKRHDHILSPESATVGSCNGEWHSSSPPPFHSR